jgi:hypothetical protein
MYVQYGTKNQFLKETRMKLMRMGWVALGAALVLSACGGGSGTPEFKSVVVFGDSLADVGTFGFKFTVQKAGDPKGYPV